MTEKIIIQVRQVNVKGGDLPDGFSVKLDADIDYTNVSKRTLATRCAGGSSDRVKQQAVWRKMKPKQLIELSAEGVIKLDGNTIGSQSTSDLLANMNLVDFNRSLGDYLEATDIITAYANKNGLKREDVLVEYMEKIDNEYTE